MSDDKLLLYERLRQRIYAWCKQRFPNSTVNYVVADLLAIPPQWHQAFDKVFECRNIQSLPLNVRSGVISSVASLVAPGGRLLLITCVRDTELNPLVHLGHYQTPNSNSLKVWDYSK